MNSVSTYIRIACMIAYMLLLQSSSCSIQSQAIFNFVNETNQSAYVAVSQADISPYLLFSVYDGDVVEVAPGKNYAKFVDDEYYDDEHYIYDKIYILVYYKSTLDKYTKKELIEKNIYDGKLVLDFKTDGYYHDEDDEHKNGYPTMTFYFRGL